MGPILMGLQLQLRAEVPGFAVDSAARALPIETSMHQEKRTSFNITITAASQILGIYNSCARVLGLGKLLE